MSGDREELIRQRAYALWEKDGGRHGRHDDHWAQATREIDGEAAPKARRTARVAGGKPAAIGAKAATKAPARAKTAGATKALAGANVKPAKAVVKPPKAAARSKLQIG